MAPEPGSLLSWLGFTLLIALSRGQVFQPSFILMSSPSASSFFVANTSDVAEFTAVEVDNTGGFPSPSCGGVNKTVNWFLAWNKLQSQNSYEVTLTWSSVLCPSNRTDCCTLCVARTFLVTACQSSKSVSSLIIQAAIYSNSTFTGTVSENATVIPNQVYQPLGSCPCNLTAGACDIGCCCDQECTSNITLLFNGFCFPGIFGGNVTPAFDQLCSVQCENNAPDWFPFLCVQSSLANSPFLGYFYQGTTVSPAQVPSFQIIFPSNSPSSAGGYKQGDPILTQNNEYFTIPQPMGGFCIKKSPVAFLRNFNVTCIIALTNENISDLLAVKINTGSGEETLTLNVTETRVFDNRNFITVTNTGASVLTNSCVDVILEAVYTFAWQTNKLNAVNVAVTMSNVCLNQSATLTQRFVANFVSANSSAASRTLSGNPGYQLGKPVLVLNTNASHGVGTLNLWTTAGRGFCSSAAPTPILFGEDSTRGCLLNTNFNNNCSLLREDVMAHFRLFLQAQYVAMRGNSNTSDPSEWVQIIYTEPNTTSMDFGNLKGYCLNVPTNLNIQILTANVGAVEGILQQAILGVKISFSTVSVNCGDACTNFSFPVSASVQFIKVPAQEQTPLTRFQLNYTEYDCSRNDVCWPQLAYPLTQYYTGEPYSQTLAKGMVLVVFFILAAVLGGPWDKIREAWNNSTF